MSDRRLLIVEDDPGLQSQMRWCFDDVEVLVAGDTTPKFKGAYILRAVPDIPPLIRPQGSGSRIIAGGTIRKQGMGTGRASIEGQVLQYRIGAVQVAGSLQIAVQGIGSGNIAPARQNSTPIRQQHRAIDRGVEKREYIVRESRGWALQIE